MGGYYILDGKEPKQINDFLEWAKSYEDSNRIVEQTNFGEVLVSTVFLGLDHSYYPNDKPLLFETMIFGGEHDQYQERYSTWDEAIEGHKIVCELINQIQTT